MPARVDDPSRAPSPTTTDPADPEPEREPGSGRGPERATRPPVDDASGAGVDRLRALLGAPEPWRDRVADRLAGTVLALQAGSARRRLVVVVAAAGLGVLAFVVVSSGGAPPVDPVQVLPRVGATAGTDHAPTAVDGSPPAPASTRPDTAPGSVPPTIAVHAAGAVLLPGVHRVSADARVADLIATAGGLAPDADPDRINLAAPVHDGERIYVPRRGELAAPDVVAGQGGPPAGGGVGGGGAGGGAGEGGPASPPSRVDLNTADAAALDALPGVGPTTAAAIIGHRTEHGPFATVDELQEVAGIGPAKLAQLRDLVTV